MSKMPAIFLAHGAPPLLDDAGWMGELHAWANALPRPTAILMLSAHWTEKPTTLGATTTVPLVYDFYGFPERYYRVTYGSPGAAALAERVRALLAPHVADEPTRGLDHGAFIPLLAMYPKADIPVLQVSLPTMDPRELFDLGQKLAPLRDEGVLIVGSGFMTHGLPFIREYMGTGKTGAPQWSVEFDRWAVEALERRDLDSLFDFRASAPGMPYAHPTVEHFAPLFVALGAASVPDATPDTVVEGYWYGLSKRSFQMR